ncbi:heme exporter protein CcmC [Alphaproteobacteria bacterium]|nr:heme exporter protein CcmC [Alphaproteobacteria bacterium]
MLNYFLKLKNFDRNFRIFAPLSLALMFIFLGFGAIAVVNSPIDYQQGNAVKIMYLHVPCAWLALMIYCLLALFNLAGFIWKNPFFYIIAKAIAKIGCLFTLITLLTGSIWGKPIWGTWWVFDPRLTSMLILFFLYVGYLVLLVSFEDQSKGEKISAVISIIGFINIPIIKFSVEYWNSLHQKASIIRTKGIAIDPTMLKPLMIMSAMFFCYFIFLSLILVKNSLMLKKLNKKY